MATGRAARRGTWAAALLLACAEPPADDGATSTSTGAPATSGIPQCETGPGASCVERLEAALGLGEPGPSCGDELVKWSALEVCFLECDAQFPPPDDEGFCGCLTTDCADLLMACGDGAAALCELAGSSTGGSSSGGSSSGGSSSGGSSSGGSGSGSSTG